jgi:glycosyltransferase involved in cell wall biosynthesis
VIWFDVSAVMSWRRPPSGTIRAQIEIGKELLKLPDRINLCVFRSGVFVPVTRQAFDSQVEFLSCPKVTVPDGANALPAAFLHRLYAGAMLRCPSIVRRALRLLVRTAIRLRLPVDQAAGGRLQQHGRGTPPTARIAPGDTYISVGFEWTPEDKIGRVAELRSKGVHTVLFCHDLIPLLFPHLGYGPSAERFPQFLTQLVQAADGIMCNSENTRKDLEAFIRNSGATKPAIATVPFGSTGPVVASDAGSLASRITRDFILYVSTLERRKNHETLYKAFVTIRVKLGKRPPMCVLVGAKGWGVDDVLSDIKLDPRVKGDFLILNQASDGELRWLYEHCLFTVFPSLYEGWGMPVAESLSYGKFVLAANRSSIPEAGGTFAEYLEPWNVRKWAERILLYTEDRDLLRQRELTIQAGHEPRSWKAAAQAVRDVATRVARLDADKARAGSGSA